MRRAFMLLLGSICAVIVLSLLEALLFADLPEESVSAYFSALLFIAVAALAAVLYRDELFAPIAQRQNFIKLAALYTLFMLTANYGAGILWDMFRPETTTENQLLVQRDFAHLPLSLYVIYVVIAAPVFEEILFRYIIQGGIGRRKWPGAHWVGLAVGIALFALAHGGFHVDTLRYLPTAIVLGVCYDRTNNVQVSIAVHMCNNLIATCCKLL